jgi:uncharacterized membrane protein
MDKVIVAVFETEKGAYDGLRALKELDAEGIVSTYATAVLARDGHGVVTTKQATEPGPLGTTVGLFTGLLAGLIAGPAGFAIGLGVGTLGGVVYDLAKLGISDDFVSEAAKMLAPRKFALVAEIWEEWVTPLDSRIEAAGGVLLRRNRGELIDAQIERDAMAFRAEFASLKAEVAGAAKAAKASLQARLEAGRDKVRQLGKRAETALEVMQHETTAKVQALQAKVAKVRGDHKAKFEKRIAEVRADYERRSKKLAQARDLVKEALS